MFEYAKAAQNEKRKIKNGPAMRPNLTGIPDEMKMRFENLSGISFDNIKIHYNSDKPAQLQALAYTHGNQVYIAPWQEKHLGHELGHVLQQKRWQVKPTTQINGLPVNDDETLERDADRLAFTQTGCIMPQTNVIQRLRIILNKDEAQAGSFDALSKADISKNPLSHIPTGGEASEGHVPVGGAVIKVADIDQKGLVQSDDEEIVFLGHGYRKVLIFGENRIEENNANDLTKLVINILAQSKRINSWRGKVVLLACNTSGLAEEMSSLLYSKLNRPISVVGTNDLLLNSYDDITDKVLPSYKKHNQYQDLKKQAELFREIFERILSSIDKKLSTEQLMRKIDELHYLEKKILNLFSYSVTSLATCPPPPFTEEMPTTTTTTSAAITSTIASSSTMSSVSPLVHLAMMTSLFDPEEGEDERLKEREKEKEKEKYEKKDEKVKKKEEDEDEDSHSSLFIDPDPKPDVLISDHVDNHLNILKKRIGFLLNLLSRGWLDFTNPEHVSIYSAGKKEKEKPK